MQVVEQPANGLDYLRDLVQPVLRPLALTGLVLIFTIFMLTRRFDLRHRLLGLVGIGQINMMTQALDDAAQRVSRYLLMQVLVNAGFGALLGFGLYCIGVPNAALWGVVAGLLRIVPYGRPMRHTAYFFWRFGLRYTAAARSRTRKVNDSVI